MPVGSPPAAIAARSATNHSGRLPPRIATPRPGSRPSSIKPAAGAAPHLVAVLAPGRGLPLPSTLHAQSWAIGVGAGGGFENLDDGLGHAGPQAGSDSSGRRLFSRLGARHVVCQ